jgi:nucleotide-binding universal stress UspA family protein
MYKHILIATDGSELAGRALEHGLALAKKVNASVTLVTVTEQWSPFDMAHKAREGVSEPTRQFEKMAADSANAILTSAEQYAKKAGVDCDRVHIPDQNPADGIVAVAENKRCDLIVMASHGRRAVKRMLLGSHVSEVLARSAVPALVVR